MNAPFNLEEYILHHMQDSSQWRLPFLPPLQLPYFLSLHGLMLIIAAVFLVGLFCFIYDKKARVPRRFTNLLEVLVIFIRDEIAVKSIGEEDGRRMTPFLCTMFFFILTLNLMGLIPIFSAATANPNVTGALAFFTLCFMIFGTIYKNGFKGFQKALVPAGVPKGDFDYFGADRISRVVYKSRRFDDPVVRQHACGSYGDFRHAGSGFIAGPGGPAIGPFGRVHRCAGGVHRFFTGVYFYFAHGGFYRADVSSAALIERCEDALHGGMATL